MSTIAIVYEPDDNCQDPSNTDHNHHGRRHGELIKDGTDALVFWREQVGNPDSLDGHSDVHILGMGAFENIRIKDVKKFLRKIGLAPS